MAGTVSVSIVSVGRGILYVGHVDGDPPVPLLRGVINGAIVLELGQTLGGEHLGDGGGERGLAVIHMAYGAYVAVGLVPLEHLLLPDTGGEGEGAGQRQDLGGDQGELGASSAR